MSMVWISSDWHIGHKNIHKFRCKEKGFPVDFEDEGNHRDWLLESVSNRVNKRDTLILLGDIAFNEESLMDVHKRVKGRKILVKGNHDLKKSVYYDSVFDQVHGLLKYKGIWMSHAPVHPAELRGKPNFHGHVHSETLPDTRYQNCCVEELVKTFGEPCAPLEILLEYRSQILKEK